MSKRRNAGSSKIAIAYLRVSTDTERQALGVEAQRQAIETWANKNKVTIAAWYTEEVSGGAALDKRPVFLEAIAATVVHRAGLLVVQRLDRFSREPMTAALAELELQRNGATLACADGAGSGDDPTSELVRGILLHVHKFEKAMIKARIKAALAVKKTRGEMTGAPKFGFRLGSDGTHVEPDPTEQRIVERIHELRSRGLAIRAIAEELECEGFVGRTGRPVSRDTVHIVVSRKDPDARGASAPGSASAE